MSTPSIVSAIQKLSTLFSREEKLTWLSMVFFALWTSLLEVLAASVIVVFAQALNQPTTGKPYLTFFFPNTVFSDTQIILYIAIACGLVYFVKNMFAGAEIFYQNFSLQKMSYHLKNRLMARYAQVDYGFYLTRNSSVGATVMDSDMEMMFSSGLVPLASVLSESVVFVFLVSMIIFMNPSLALIIFGTGLLIGLGLSKGLLPQFYRWGQRLQDAILEGRRHLFQFFHAFKEIVLLGKREAFMKAYQVESLKKSHIHAIQTATNALPRMVIEMLFVGLFVISVVYLCFKHESPASMVGILGGYLYVGFRLMPGLNRIINQLNSFKYIIPSIERIHQEYHTVGAQDFYEDCPALQFSRSITFRDVGFQYLNTNRQALSHINLQIQKGECLGIVGETGSGKSTLSDLLLGLLKPTKGTILIDDQYPVHSYQWHQKIGYVPQAIYLTDDTIQANIAFGEKPDSVDVVRLQEAIAHAQLCTFIEQLPQGVHTVVGERGIRLSGGERQRIAIARALYHQPEVLIFDEATSALDHDTESRLMETIHSVSQHRTVIMIAHRLSTLQDCHRVVVMDKGLVKEITDYTALKHQTVRSKHLS